MLIRDFTPNDKQAVLGMAEAFYDSPGVLHRIPIEHFAAVYDEMCNGGSSRLRGLVLQVEGQPAGYCQLAFSYSVEAGGPVVQVEEVYILEEYRGIGLGSDLFGFLREEYGGSARLRLEVAPGNTRAVQLYERLGFERLPYIQMILEDF